MCKDNFIFVKNSDSENICEIVANKIIYIDLMIELSFLILLQLHVFCHDIDFATVDSQMHYLKFFVSSEKVFFNIWVEDFIWCFSILSFSRSLIVEIYSTIDDFLLIIMWEISEYLHCTHLFHDYTFWAFCDIILILSIRCRRLKVDFLNLKSVKSLLLSKFIVWFDDLDC